MHVRSRRRRPAARSALLALAALAAFLVPVQLTGTAGAEGGVPGTLDPAFDTDGIALNELVSGISRVDDSARQPTDGRVLVLADGRVWRFLPDGTLDISFDQDGVLQPASSDALRPTRLALRPNGAGFVLAGTAIGTGCPAGRVAEFDAGGNIVTTFGTNGVACINFANFNGISDLAVQDDGRVLVLGSHQAAGGASGVALARLSNTGTTVNPVVQDHVSTFETGEEMAFQNGNLVVVGTTNTYPNFLQLGVVLSRYVLSGDTMTLDTTFGGGDGINVESVFLDRARRPLHLAVQPEGEGMSVLAAGDNPVGAAGGPRVAAFEQLLFDEDGVLADSPVDVELAGHSFVVADDLTATPAGYVAAGHFEDSAPGSTTDGLVTIALGQGYTEPDPLLISRQQFGLPLAGGSGQLLPDGSVLLASVLAGPAGRQLLFNRLVEDTSADPPTVTLDPDLGTAFGQRGFRVTSGSTRDAAQAVTVQSDRKVVVGGHSSSASGSPAGPVGDLGFVLRHAENGSLDPTFGDSPQPGVTFVHFEVNGVALAPGGRVVAAGSLFIPGDGESDQTGAVQRLLADGSPDPQWYGGQPTHVAPAGNTLPGTFLRDVAVQPDGGVIVVGDVHTCPGVECTTDNSILVARLTPIGTLDGGFGDGGFALIGPVQGDNVGLAQGNGVVLQPGKIVVTGSLGNRLVVARLNANGTRDGSFAAPPGPFGSGVLADDLAPGNLPHQAVGRDIALRPGGRIVVAGDLTLADCSIQVACVAIKRAIAVAYTTVGVRDGSFGTRGLVQILPTTSQGRGVAVDDAGNVLVGGLTGGGDVLLARLTPRGAPDPAFGTNGLTRTHVNQDAAGNGLALAPDGKIVVAGLNSDSVGTRVLTARYEPGGVLHCLPPTLTFGSVVLGTGPASGSTTCTNTGPSRLQITGVAVSGANTADFAVSTAGCLQVTLAPGQACQLPVTFTPGAVGIRSAVLTVAHSQQGRAGPVPVQLTGTGLARNTTLSFKPNPLTFPEQLGLATSGPRTVTVTNAGNDKVVVNGVGVTDNPQGDFAISASTCTGVTLPPGGRCTVSVTFTPRAPGARTAVLRFDDTGAGAPHLLALRGTGAVPTLTLDPGVARLGGVTVAAGAKFPPKKTVTLVWAEPGSLLSGGFVEPGFSVTSNADGTLTAPALIFRKSRTGSRALLATAGAFTANAPLLVAAGSLQPPDFVYRR
jgi:uncharacterized delta-60 repeat protein